MTDVPVYAWVLVFVGAVGIPAVTGVVLHGGAVAAGLGRRTATAVASVAVLAWLAWVAVATLLAGAGAFQPDPGAVRPWIAMAVIGALFAALLAARVPVVAKALAAPDMAARLARPQVFRVIGAVFVTLMVAGTLPAAFALPAGLGDVAVGIGAWFVARRGPRGLAVFNALGLLDLVVAVGMGFLGGLGPHPFVPMSPPTGAMGLLPLALVPTTAVPLAAALHVVSLARLRSATPVSQAGYATG